ncbi:hypothetical protein [Oceanidesulfovibrio marinus]|uniref:Uncharacterized protein n=1 Tax=Oceanidesulfovibrio marinus TaxID=370038 RepID=A0A6P1ZHR1_9BACT|nr:hypothetical protein [Oceanidesulfovibrio marinus]QJT08413.1 hypothetical protein E8L03_05505 [Oceanidesulfovibrio marinus]TVM33117.1 hypothetical protein DQK91_13235 [Oceanidesulfovibrio marinus]
MKRPSLSFRFLAIAILALCVILGATGTPLQAAKNTQAPPTPWNVTGVWEGQFLAVRLEAHLEQGTEAVHEGLANRIFGVVYSISPLGSKTTYHIAGLIHGNTITGIHGSGHSFKGTISDNGNRIDGVVLLSGGQELPLCATRRREAAAK